MAQALVPLKDLVLAKSRLAGVLTRVERRLLAQAMAEDVLAVLSCHKNITRITLVYDDPGASMLVQKYGADCWTESSLGCRGLNPIIQCASERLLTLTGLSGTLKRNPLACYQTDSHHRTPLHWLMLNPKLKMSMLHEFLNFNNNACTPGLRIVDRHGENNAFNYFLDSHVRIGYKEWKKCLDYLAAHHIAGEILHEVDPFYLVGVKSKGNHLSGTVLMKLGGRVPRIRCDAPKERQHLQGNPQMMSNQMREDRTKDHPDEVRGFELRSSSQGYQRTIVGGVIGKQKIYL